MRILVAGDFCPQNRVAELINKEDYQSVFGEVGNLTQQADYSIVNLECPVVEHQATPIDKCGPNLKCTTKGVASLKWAGFNCATLANNHFYDYGEIGIFDTIAACKSNNLDYVGGGKDIISAGQILYKELQGKTFAIINCCEHEFSIATERTGGSNPLNIVKQYYDIQEARKRADHVIVIVHGGVELFWLPSRRMMETYRFFIDAGADAVINHHQHCYSGYDVYKGKPIFYGLGNFCFDWFSDDYRWTSGFMVQLDFPEVGKVRFDLFPYVQGGNTPGVCLMQGEEQAEFHENVKEYNEIISDENRREQEYRNWCKQKEGMYGVALNPAYTRFTKWLFKGKLGQRIISRHKLLQQYDYLVNESHIERVRMAITNKIW